MNSPHFWRHFACYTGGAALLALSVVPALAPFSVALMGAGGGLLALGGTPTLANLFRKAPPAAPPGPPAPPAPPASAA